MWFSVVCTLIANDTRHHIGQNLLWTYSAGPREFTTFDHCSLRAGSLVWKPRTGEAGEKNARDTPYPNERACLQASLVPRPQYFSSVIRFGSRGPGRSSMIRHRNQLPVKAWEKTLQELEKRGTINVKRLGREHHTMSLTTITLAVNISTSSRVHAYYQTVLPASQMRPTI